MLIRTAIHVAALLVLISPAQAQNLCGDRAEIIKSIAAKYKELPRAWGISGQRNFVELYVSDSGSFTILSTQATGLTCIVATGVDWQEMPPIIEGKPT